MAAISAVQNEPHNIQRLTAQRRLYSTAKRLSFLQPFLAGVTSIAGPVAVTLFTEAELWVGLAGILVGVINTCWLDPRQHHYRRNAANIQEDFDCNVLDLPWNDVLAGRRPAPEDVYEAVTKATPRIDTPLEDWYPAVVDNLPLHQARIVCQRTNCHWDSKLRRRYGRGICTALTVVGVFVLIMGFLTEMTLQRLVLGFAAPLSPTLLWGMREARRQEAAAAALDRLKDFVETSWQEISRKKLTEPEATRRSRELQDGILVHRQKDPLVFDWIYERRRKDDEEQMEVSAEEMVAQLNRCSHTS